MVLQVPQSERQVTQFVTHVATLVSPPATPYRRGSSKSCNVIFLMASFFRFFTVISFAKLLGLSIWTLEWFTGSTEVRSEIRVEQR